jgi:hypothetical protein
MLVTVGCCSRVGERSIGLCLEPVRFGVCPTEEKNKTEGEVRFENDLPVQYKITTYAE